MTTKRNDLVFLLTITVLTAITVMVAGMVTTVTATITDTDTTDSVELAATQTTNPQRWRGFNLIEKFTVGRNRPFVEEDFQFLHEHGFNFVRLPMDYRCWIQNGDWNVFNEKTLKEIDDAISLGKKYGIHVQLNFHRAPGYCVNPPKEAKDLWTDAEAQETCAKHWNVFANRYRDIPSSELSFNLFNEPSNVPKDVYLPVVEKMVAAIRSESPDRLIVCDGLSYGTKPMPELTELGLMQATRGYFPMQISHYKASWITGAEAYLTPTWPLRSVSGLLCSPSKKDLHAPLRITGPFPVTAQLRLRVNTVSVRAVLRATTETGEELFRHDFQPGPGEGEWKRVVYQERYRCYQNVYDNDYEIVIPAGTQEVAALVLAGDWLSLSEVAITQNGTTYTCSAVPHWDRKPSHLSFDSTTGELRGGDEWNKTTLRQQMEPWLVMGNRIPTRTEPTPTVYVGEFGSHNRTPHGVALAWLEDNLANWQEVQWGWALWNLRGSFGVMDSGRTDVQYEDYHGRKLDRKMLELLKRY